MRKYLVLILCLLFVGCSQVNAEQPIKIVLNGREIVFDISPQNIDGRVMVPFRAIGESLGARVEWDEDKQLVTMYLNENYVFLTIGQTRMNYGLYSNNEIITENTYMLDVAPQIIDGRTMVPVRAISEGLSCNVRWDSNLLTVYITNDYESWIRETPKSSNTQQMSEITGTITNSDALLELITQNINNNNTTFTIKTENLSEEDYKINLFDYFDVMERYEYTATSLGNKTDITYNITYSMYHQVTQAYLKDDISELNPRELAVYNVAIRVINDNIRQGMSDYEKELIIHDYIVLNTSYDQENVERNTITEDSKTPYGVLINKIGICSGYSSTFKMFMNMLDIECDIVTGSTYAGEHAWNRVKIDGKYYLVDVTWNDPVPDKEGRVRYSYFNLTDQMMAIDHTTPVISDKMSNSLDWNYFYYNNLIIHDQTEFEKHIAEAVKSKKPFIALKGSNFDVKTLELERVFDYYPNTFGYSKIENQNIIEIEF